MADPLARGTELVRPEVDPQNHQVSPGAVIVTTSDVVDDETAYNTFTPFRKRLIVATLSLAGFNAAMDTMAVSAAIPEIAAEFNTTGTVINISNAVYVLVMAFSPAFWGPLSQVYGRRWIGIASTALFTAFSLGAALSPNLVAYFIFRSLAAFETTAFYVLGSSCIGDIYRPEERGTALSWFLLATVVAPAIGPFIGGVIVTYRTWRILFWLQAALGALAMGLMVFFLPETIKYKLKDDLGGYSVSEKVTRLCNWLNPVRVVKLLRYPNLLVAYLASSSLIWNQQCLLTPIRYIINPRFNLTSPLLSGLFFLAPGVGYLVGTVIGGRWADITVKRAIQRRGKRISEDRLRSTLVSIGLISPASVLIYGWAIDQEVGGVALPVISMFLQGVGHMICFPSLNAYCLDVMPERSTEVISGAYLTRYVIGAIGTATVLPVIQAIGLGWFSTISAVFLLLSHIAIYLLIRSKRG